MNVLVCVMVFTYIFFKISHLVTERFHVELLRICQKRIFYFGVENIYLFIFFPLFPVVNAPTRLLVPKGHLKYGFMSLKDNWQMGIGTPEVVHELRLKRETPIGSKDVPP